MNIKEIERLTTMEVEMKVLKEDNSKDHANILNEVSCLRKDFKEFITKADIIHEKMVKDADNKFASKITEKIVYSMIGAVCLAILYAILNNLGI